MDLGGETKEETWAFFHGCLFLLLNINRATSSLDPGDEKLVGVSTGGGEPSLGDPDKFLARKASHVIFLDFNSSQTNSLINP